MATGRPPVWKPYPPSVENRLYWVKIDLDDNPIPLYFNNGTWYHDCYCAYEFDDTDYISHIMIAQPPTLPERS